MSEEIRKKLKGLDFLEDTDRRESTPAYDRPNNPFQKIPMKQ